MNAHTPGPWKAVKNPMRDDGYFVVQDTGKYFTQEIGISHSQIREGDAQLVAAAPDLLAIAKGLTEWLYAIRDTHEGLVIQHAPDGINLSDALDVIAKAEAKP